MQSLISILRCSGLASIISYINPTVRCEEKSPEKPWLTKEELALSFRQENCDHDWSTCLTDLSPIDDFGEYIDGDYFDAEVFWRCERCQLKQGVRQIKVKSTILNHGNRIVVGRLSLSNFQRKLLHDQNNTP